MSKGKEVSWEEKKELVEKYLAGEVGYTSAYEKIEVAETTFRRWINQYKMEGAIGLQRREKEEKYSKETKLSAVKDYLAGKGSLQDICNKYKIRHINRVADWIKVYNRHEDFKEVSGGSRMTKGRETTLEERVEIARECISGGNNYGEMALKHKVSYQQVYTWTKKYREMGEVGLEDRRGHRAGTLPSRTPEEELRDQIARLERKNFELEMENALLKNVKDLEMRRR
jgi:transposase-like protein